MKRISFIIIIILACHGVTAAGKVSIAILDLTAGGEKLSQGAVDTLTQAIRDEFAKEEWAELLSREQMATKAKENGVTLSGCLEPGCAVRIGKALQTQKVVIGSVVKLGKRYSLFYRLVDTETGKVECADQVEAQTDQVNKVVSVVVKLLSRCIRAEKAREEVRQRPEDAELHYELGVALGKQRKFEEAEGEFREAIRLKPQYPEAHRDLGAVLANRGKLNEAIAELQKAILLNPKDGKGHYNLANALRMQSKFPEAITEYRKAIQLDPNDAKAHYFLANALLWRGNRAGEIAELREAIRSKPDYIAAHGDLSAALWMQGKRQEAEQESRMAREPYHDFVDYDLEVEIGEQSFLEDILKTKRNAVQARPMDANAHFDLGTELWEQDHYEEGEREVREAVRLNPDFANALQWLAYFLDFQGRRKEARPYLQRALKLETDPERLGEIKRRLAEPD